MDKKACMILFGAGSEGVNALKYLPPGSVIFFTDNDKNLWGQEINGIRVIAPTEAFSLQLPVYITPVGEVRQKMMEQMAACGIVPAGMIQQYIAANYRGCDKRIAALKGIYSGKRCFVIGTGSSLRIRDLECLAEKGEITFASNRIFKIYEKTVWRPELYCVSDLKLLRHYFEDICSLESSYQFIVNIGESILGRGVDSRRLCTENKYIFNILKDYETINGMEVPRFSDNPARYIVDGGITVTYAMLQWAYFLGFAEVYLTGVDFDYGIINGNKVDPKAHFMENYEDEGEDVNMPKLEESLKAYEAARTFSDLHNFKIYNATRGGKLEVFERVSMDEFV